jgi:transposase InsO family protein
MTQANAGCESFMSTLKREEIYANDYRDLDHIAQRIEEFIERYYHRCRLHSALEYRPPEEFERQVELRNDEPGLRAAILRPLRC